MNIKSFQTDFWGVKMRINKIPGMLLKGIGRATTSKHLKKDARKYCAYVAKCLKEERERKNKNRDTKA